MKKNKYKIGLIVTLSFIIVAFIILFSIFKKEKTKNNIDGNYNEYKTIISELLKEDNTLKKLFYSKIDVSENYLTIDNSTYYLIDKKYGYTEIKQIYQKLSHIYSYDYRKNVLTDLNDYNSFMMLDDKLYINFKAKCNIPEFSEDLLKIVNVDTENDIIKYSYDEGNYEVTFLNNVYLIDSSPFVC